MSITLPPLRVPNKTAFKLSCVLFDLDGTLVDSAPDLLASLQKTLKGFGLAAADEAHVKPYISFGAAAMLKACLPPSVTETERAALLATLLSHYESNIAEHTVLFAGMAYTLATIESLGLPWGIVTNKRERYTLPLMDALQLSHRAACIISGDTAAKPKPFAEPMLEACKRAAVNPSECVYIGDAQHDIAAGKNANMRTLVALYGYLNASDKPETWGADALIAAPEQLTRWIKTILCH